MKWALCSIRIEILATISDIKIKGPRVNSLDAIVINRAQVMDVTRPSAAFLSQIDKKKSLLPYSSVTKSTRNVIIYTYTEKS